MIGFHKLGLLLAPEEPQFQPKVCSVLLKWTRAPRLGKDNSKSQRSEHPSEKEPVSRSEHRRWGDANAE